MKTKIIFGAVIVFLTIALVAATYGWFKERNKPAVSKVEYIKVPEIKEVIKIEKVKVPGPKEIVTVEKIKIVEKLKLPEWFSSSATEQAIATGVISPYEGKTNVVATLNTETGVGSLIVKQEPLSLMGFANDKQLYAKAGYSTNKDTQISVGADWKFLRVGKIKVGVFGEGRASFGSGETGSSYPVEAVGGIIVTY
jgi:hypothetical protein